MRNFLALLFFLTAVQSQAQSDWQSQSVLVEPNSEVQGMIDSLVVDIFHSPLRDTLCNVYQNSYSVYHSLGVSERAAKTAFSDCTERIAAPSKTLRKQYYLSFAAISSLDSWTDYGNRTYLFVDESLTREQLKSMLLHEIAISLDAKTNLLYSTYLTYFTNSRGASDDGGILRNAFNQSTWKPLSLSFATLRAFQFELYYRKQSGKMDHATCARSVQEILRRIKEIPAAPRGTGAEDLSETMADLMSNKFTPQSEIQERQILEQILSDRLVLQNTQGRTVTFCQFMTEPILTGRSLYNFYGTGPRPRLTGGSGGQSSAIAPWEKLQSGVPEKNLGLSPSDSDLQLQKNLEQIKGRIQPLDTEQVLRNPPKRSFPLSLEKE